MIPCSFVHLPSIFYFNLLQTYLASASFSISFAGKQTVVLSPRSKYNMVRFLIIMISCQYLKTLVSTLVVMFHPVKKKFFVIVTTSNSLVKMNESDYSLEMSILRKTKKPRNQFFDLDQKIIIFISY